MNKFNEDSNCQAFHAREILKGAMNATNIMDFQWFWSLRGWHPLC
jgi:hypothetical protein